VEDDVDVWRYAILRIACRKRRRHAESKSKVNVQWICKAHHRNRLPILRRSSPFQQLSAGQLTLRYHGYRSVCYQSCECDIFKTKNRCNFDCDFDAKWHNRSTVQRHETINFGGQEVKGHRKPKFDLEAWRRHHTRSSRIAFLV